MAESTPNPLASAVVLRDVKEVDLPTFFEHQLDPEANRMAAFPPREREAFMRHWVKILADETIIKKTILFNGRVAGNIVSFDQDGKPQIGYWLGKKFWGKGIATHALSDFLNLVSTRPLYAHVAIGDIASRRVLEKCGFKIIAEDRGNANMSDGQIDEWVLKLSAREIKFNHDD